MTSSGFEPTAVGANHFKQFRLSFEKWNGGSFRPKHRRHDWLFVTTIEFLDGHLLLSSGVKNPRIS